MLQIKFETENVRGFHIYSYKELKSYSINNILVKTTT